MGGGAVLTQVPVRQVTECFLEAQRPNQSFVSENTTLFAYATSNSNHFSVISSSSVSQNVVMYNRRSYRDAMNPVKFLQFVYKRVTGIKTRFNNAQNLLAFECLESS